MGVGSLAAAAAAAPFASEILLRPAIHKGKPRIPPPNPGTRIPTIAGLPYLEFSTLALSFATGPCMWPVIGIATSLVGTSSSHCSLRSLSTLHTVVRYISYHGLRSPRCAGHEPSGFEPHAADVDGMGSDPFWRGTPSVRPAHTVTTGSFSICALSGMKHSQKLDNWHSRLLSPYLQAAHYTLSYHTNPCTTLDHPVLEGKRNSQPACTLSARCFMDGRPCSILQEDADSARVSGMLIVNALA